MRILVLNYEYPPLGGGAGPVCRQLCEFYAAQGHHVEVITMGFRGLAAREVLNGVHVRRVPALRRHAATCETPEMMSYVASALLPTLLTLRAGWDVIHCHFIVPTGLLAWLARLLPAGRRVPLVITSHGSDVPGFNPDRFTAEHRRMRGLLCRIGGSAQALVAPSHYLAGLIERELGLKGTHYIPNGIDVGRFRPSAAVPGRILMTGRLLPRKGFQHALRALAGVDAPWEVDIAGDGPLRAELEQIAATLPHPVRFHGWLPHDDPKLRELYETASIFCLPSEGENASIALLEAMLAGLAVVTSNVTGCPETIGETGIAVAPGNPEALRPVLARLLTDPAAARELGAAARQRVLNHFDWQVIGMQYLRLFETLTEKHP